MMSERLREPLIAAPSDMIPAYMCVVRFPENLQGEKTKAHGVKAQSVLRYQYNITACIDVIAGELWVRLSCAVYNKREDYERLVEALLDLKNHPEKLE